MRRQIGIAERNEKGDLNYFAAGERAGREGRPIFANPGVGTEADEWRRGYLSVVRLASSRRLMPSAIPEFA